MTKHLEQPQIAEDQPFFLCIKAQKGALDNKKLDTGHLVLRPRNTLA
jgi:hypothetical protein